MQINNASGLPPGEEGVLHTSGCNNASLECIAMIGFQAWNLPRSANLQGELVRTWVLGLELLGLTLPDREQPIWRLLSIAGDSALGLEMSRDSSNFYFCMPHCGEIPIGVLARLNNSTSASHYLRVPIALGLFACNPWNLNESKWMSSTMRFKMKRSVNWRHPRQSAHLVVTTVHLIKLANQTVWLDWSVSDRSTPSEISLKLSSNWKSEKTLKQNVSSLIALKRSRGT